MGARGPTYIYDPALGVDRAVDPVALVTVEIGMLGADGGEEAAEVGCGGGKGGAEVGDSLTDRVRRWRRCVPTPAWALGAEEGNSSHN